MATQEQIVTTKVPEYISDRQQELLNTLFGTQQAQGLLQLPQIIPQQQVAGFSPTQEAAMNLAFQGIGAFQPFIQASQAAQTAGLGSAAAGAEALRQMNFEPSRVQQFMDPYQQAVTQEAVKEIDRQAALAQNQLAGQAVKAGAFGGSRFGIQADGSLVEGRAGFVRLLKTFNVDKALPDLYKTVEDFALQGGNLPSTETSIALAKQLTLGRATEWAQQLNNTEVGLLIDAGPQVGLTKEGQRLLLETNLFNAQVNKDAL